MAETNYREMNTEELEAALHDAMSERAEVVARQRAIAAQLDERRRAEALAHDVAKLEERHGVTIRPQGIDSRETVGEPK